MTVFVFIEIVEHLHDILSLKFQPQILNPNNKIIKCNLINLWWTSKELKRLSHSIVFFLYFPYEHVQ